MQIRSLIVLAAATVVTACSAGAQPQGQPGAAASSTPAGTQEPTELASSAPSTTDQLEPLPLADVPTLEDTDAAPLPEGRYRVNLADTTVAFAVDGTTTVHRERPIAGDPTPPPSLTVLDDRHGQQLAVSIAHVQGVADYETDSWQARDQLPDDLAGWMADQPYLEVLDRDDTTIGGRDATRIDLQATDGWQTAHSSDDSVSMRRLLVVDHHGGTDTWRYLFAPSDPSRWWIIDVDDGLYVIATPLEDGDPTTAAAAWLEELTIG